MYADIGVMFSLGIVDADELWYDNDIAEHTWNPIDVLSYITSHALVGVISLQKINEMRLYNETHLFIKWITFVADNLEVWDAWRRNSFCVTGVCYYSRQ